MTAPPRATGIRDASWFDRPDVRTPKRVHLLAEDANVLACDRRIPGEHMGDEENFPPTCRRAACRGRP